MGRGKRKKTPFIDKKRAITFEVVHRSQRDPLIHENVNQFVLKPTGRNIDESSSSFGWNFPNFSPSVVQEESSEHEGEYNYMRHLLPMSGTGVFVDASGAVQERAPDLAFGTLLEDQVGYLTNIVLEDISAEDLDPDILHALENADEHEELLDNFIMLANQSDSDIINDPTAYLIEEGDIERMYGDDFSIDDEFDALDNAFAVEFDFSIEDDDKIEYLTPQQDPNIKLSKERELLTEKFDAELEKDSFEFSDSDDRPAQKMSMLVHQVLDDFLINDAPQSYVHATSQSLKYLSQRELEDYFEDSSSIEMEPIMVKEKAQWDCESILSTYTNTENHPQIIEIPKLDKIVVNKKGFPVIQKQEEEKEEIVVENFGKKRDRNETPQEKAERKRIIKEQKRNRRTEKKAVKEEFNEEIQKQRNLSAQSSFVNKTIIKY